jgi:hypothetical protein
MEDYHWVMFTHAIDFFKEPASLKKLILEHFFTSLFNYLSIEDLVTLGNLLSTKNLKPQKQLYVILGMQAWLPEDLRNKLLKQLLNRQMIGPALKPQDVYDS